MLINEFDLDLKEEDRQEEKNDFLCLKLQRNKVKMGFKKYVLKLIKDNEKGIYKISPICELIIK